MSRPEFLSSPGVWIRASRISQTRADYACPIECRRVERAAHRWMVALIIVAGLLAGLGLLGD